MKQPRLTARFFLFFLSLLALDLCIRARLKPRAVQRAIIPMFSNFVELKRQSRSPPYGFITETTTCTNTA